MPKKGPSTVEDRLHRIEGQIRGIEKLVEADQSTQKVLMQVQAVISSLESVKIELVKKEVKESLVKNLDSALQLIR